jgi:hypothetical protein
VASDWLRAVVHAVGSLPGEVVVDEGVVVEVLVPVPVPAHAD